MDMFGPLQIRLNRRTLQEAQVAIFTCATKTRAVHLELVTDKSTKAFRMVLSIVDSHVCAGTQTSADQTEAPGLKEHRNTWER